MLKAWILVALILTADAKPAWQVVDRFEFRGQCEEASLLYSKPGEKISVVTCVFSPNGVLR